MFILKRRRDSLNEAFVERTKKTRNKKGKKISCGRVVSRSQKAWYDESSKLEVEVHQSLIRMRIWRDVKLMELGVMSESTPVEQGHDFATLTGTLNR